MSVQYLRGHRILSSKRPDQLLILYFNVPHYKFTELIVTKFKQGYSPLIGFGLFNFIHKVILVIISLFEFITLLLRLKFTY